MFNKKKPESPFERPTVATEGSVIEKSAEEEDVVTVSFFDTRDEDKVLFTVELERSELTKYERAAEALGVSFEQFIYAAVERKLEEDNTQWVAPGVTADGELSMEQGTVIDLSAVAESSENKSAEG